MKISTIPPKRLAETITASDTTFKLNDILGFDDVALTEAIVGDKMYGSFQSVTGTELELFEVDTSTIASASITMLKRGLQFNEDGTEAEVGGNKKLWIKNQTIVNLGTDVPQLYNLLVKTTGDQTIAGTKTFSSSPQVPTPDSANDAVNKDYADTKVSLTGDESVDGVKTFIELPKVPVLPLADDDVASKKFVNDTAAYGAPLADEDTAGIVEIATQAQVDAGTDTGETGAKLAVLPSQLASIATKTFVAGENLTAKDAVFVAKGDEARRLSAYSSSDSSGSTIGTTQWLYQSFLTSANTTKIGRIRMKWSMGGSSGFPDPTCTVRLRATPNGADIATVVIVSPANGEGIVDAVFTGTVVSPNTTYYIVINRSGTAGGTVTWYGGTVSSYANGTTGRSTDSGVNWTSPDPTVTGDFYFEVLEGDYTAGKVYKTVAATDYYSGAGLTANFIGFATASVSAAANAVIKLIGAITGLTGLTTGVTYYLSNTPGAIASSAGTVSKKVGISLSTTDLLIKHDNS